MANVNSGDTIAQVIQPVIGDALSGASDTGSEPVKVGGRFNTAQPTLTDGQRADMQLTSRGALVVAWSNDPGLQLGHPADSSANSPANLSNLYVTAQNESYNGNSWDRARSPVKFIVVNAAAINTETTIWTPAAGKKFRLMGFMLHGSSSAMVTLRDNTAGTIIAKVFSNSGGPSVMSPPMGNGILSAAANNVLTATGDAVSNLDAVFFGTEE